MRLNLGCGAYPLAGFVNVDFRALPGVAVIADARALPFVDGAAREVYAGHILEHFPEEAGAALLAEWWRVVAPGGALTVVIPDCEKTRRWLRQGRVTEAWYRHVLHGDPTTKGMRHHARYDAASLARALDRLPDRGARVPVDLDTDARLTSAVGWQSGWTIWKEDAR